MKVQVVEVAPDVFLVVGPRTNWCLIRDGDAITLIDAAWPKDYPVVVDSLRQIGAGPGQVDAVVLDPCSPRPRRCGRAIESRAWLLLFERTWTKSGTQPATYHQRVRTIDLVIRMWRPSVAAFAVGSIARGGTDPTPVADVEALRSFTARRSRPTGAGPDARSYERPLLLPPSRQRNRHHR